MTFMTEQEKANLAEAIRQVEAKTSGELVTVIAHSSDDYLFIPTLWAALLALALPGLMTVLPYTILHDYTYSLQVSVFVLIALLLRWPPLLMRIIPAQVKRQRAHRHAMQQFIQQNLHLTEQHNGILLFVSVAEHYVEIIADKGINDLVENDAWENIVTEFGARVKQGKVADGFLSAIQQCGDILATHFPIQAGDKDELPNHLIEV